MPCITELHSLFYYNGVKIVPLNIYDLLTPAAIGGIGLWEMDLLQVQVV